MRIMFRIALTLLIVALPVVSLVAADNDRPDHRQILSAQLMEFQKHVKSIEANTRGRLPVMITDQVLDSIKTTLKIADSIWNSIELDSLTPQDLGLSEYDLGMVKYRYELEIEAIDTLKSAIKADNRQKIIYAANQLKCELNRIFDILEGKEQKGLIQEPRPQIE